MQVAHADDSALFREGLALLLRTAGIEVAVQTQTGQELQARLPGVPVDVAILDIRMPPTYTDEGLVAAKSIRQAFPTLGVLVLSTYVETVHAVDLLSQNSSGVGYLLKDRVDNLPTLVDALERISSGGTVIDPEIVLSLLQRRNDQSPVNRLSPREKEVLEHMAQGRSNEGIATHLCLSIKTVEKAIAQIFDSFGLRGSRSDNRRVLAVLELLKGSTG